MARINTVSKTKAFEGIQGVYEHDSHSTACKMTFSVYMPPAAELSPVPVIWYLSGLTCTHANVMDKGEYRRLASELGLAIVCPDTSPRGENIPDESDNWQFGTGAAFYLDATQAPYADNYNMYSYIVTELPNLIGEHFNVDLKRQGIMGHSMGGHGALTIALKNEGLYKSCSAFAPIVSPSTSDWSATAFEKFLGKDPLAWTQYDAVELISLGHRFPEFLVDQGDADDFLEEGLKPWLLEAACAEAELKLTLRMQEGYDHSYSFISTFMDDHIRWHGERLLTSR
jgi:S-formylglutathione hydrolase